MLRKLHVVPRSLGEGNDGRTTIAGTHRGGSRRQHLVPHSYYLRPLYAQDRSLGERLANEQERQFLTRTMQAKCKTFGTTMEVEGEVGTIPPG
jgi:hypothetical protein